MAKNQLMEGQQDLLLLPGDLLLEPGGSTSYRRYTCEHALSLKMFYAIIALFGT